MSLLGKVSIFYVTTEFWCKPKISQYGRLPINRPQSEEIDQIFALRKKNEVHCFVSPLSLSLSLFVPVSFAFDYFQLVL